MIRQSIKLSDLVQVGTRFGRSVNLERDFGQQSSFEGYILTTTASAILHRIASGLANSSSPRAWTLTGPYGCGKSALALFAAGILSTDGSEATATAHQILKAKDEPLWQTLFDRRRVTALHDRGVCPVLVSGSRERLDRALLRGLIHAIQHFRPANLALLLAEAQSLLAAVEAENPPPGRQVVALFEQVAWKICSFRNPGNGLLVIIDELGKFLEYAATHPSDGDIFLLQELAEATKRSAERPILLLTILHQSFDQYVERLGRGQKEEWMKVQGRFEDIAFQEPIEQIVRILAQAIDHKAGTHAVRALQQHGRKLAKEAIELQLVPTWIKSSEEANILGGCLPLHPTVALSLGHVFRRLGQNERSLFAFLTSHEPGGFQEFIINNRWDAEYPPTMRLDHLYDYIVNALGNGLYAQGNGKKWVEIETALHRLTEPTELEIRLVKTIGLLNAVGDIGYLKPSKKLLQFALSDRDISARDVARGLEQLEKRSIIIYRRYRDGFGLWEGSDLNIESKIKESRVQLGLNASPTHTLEQDFKTRPLVARRHSLRTGTLRFFEIRYTDVLGFDEVLAKPPLEADGVIIYTIGSNSDEVANLTRKAGEVRLPHVLIAIPRNVQRLQDAISEVACLRRVLENTPELQSDPTARREIQAHLANAEGVIEHFLWSMFEVDAQRSDCTRPNMGAWYRNGEPVSIQSARSLQEYLSDMCDEVFCKSPQLRNELINRRHLSSSAAAARRELIVAMLTQAHEARLAIDGFPPQLSIYFSLLENTGIHRKENGRWGFYPPMSSADLGVTATWDAMEDFFAETEVKRRSVADLFDILGRPPYGIKAGPQPIILCAALLHYDTEIALYEQGSFVPALSADVMERLVKSPGKFDVQRCRIAGVRAEVFERFANAILQRPEQALAAKPNILAVVRPLARFASSLPAYTKNTQRLSANALRVRDVLLAAREPDQLLFVQLPEACEATPFNSAHTREPGDIDVFFRNLRESLSELQRAYDDLLGNLEKLLIAAFSLRTHGAEARSELVWRAQALLDLTVDPKLKSFVIRVCDQGLDLISWIESIATLLASKPPALWHDTDLARFEVNLADVARNFLHIELLSFELRKHDTKTRGEVEVMRLGITIPNEPEQERILTIRKQDRMLIQEAESSVEQSLEAAGLDGNLELRLAVLARLSQKFLNILNRNGQQKASGQALTIRSPEGI